MSALLTPDSSIVRYLLCLFCLTTLRVSAQDSLRQRPHQLSLLLGPGKLITQDEALSPLRYRGTTLAYRLAYAYRGAKNEHHVALDFMAPTLRADVEPFSFSDRYNLPTALAFRTEYAYWQIRQVNTALRVRYGGQLSFNGWIKTHEHGNLLTVVDMFSSLGLGAALDYTFTPQQQISGQVSYPLIGRVIQQSYGFASIDGASAQQQWLVPHRLVNPQFAARYTNRLSPRWNLLIAYRFVYFQYDRPFMTKNAIHALQFGAAFRL